ncbi:MAG: DUF5060 domain-containing protein, partial [Planctomycetaceae bacterium]|nr:DUF5060 domain-containing protein [Planctomycetaceae bacterium]
MAISGELKRWHKITLTLEGPFARESDNEPNPFTDFAMVVHWVHSDGSQYSTPGYFAADGNAANTSADAGTAWRTHFAPDRTGQWKYRILFRTGHHVALGDAAASQSVPPFDGITGTIIVAETDKTGRDLRAEGRLQYVGRNYLRFAGSGRY